MVIEKKGFEDLRLSAQRLDAKKLFGLDLGQRRDGLRFPRQEQEASGAAQAGCQFDYGREGTGQLQPMSLIALLVGLPLLFMALGRWVVPHAPGSEFSLLVMAGVLAAFITYKLGVYYLVGAFVAAGGLALAGAGMMALSGPIPAGAKQPATG